MAWIAVPPAFQIRMERLLGGEAAAFLSSYGKAPRAGLRVNPLKVETGAYLFTLSFAHSQNPWCAQGVILAEDDAPGKHPHHAAGVYYLQEPSASAVVEVLSPQPGERILDLSAAPGGKATQIAGALAGAGVLVANEIHPQRVWDLAENLERWGARNAVVLNETPERLAERFPGYFDRVLLDAPCSGEGMFRKSEAARQDWSLELVQGCAVRQENILAAAARMVRPGGWLVYSTCTFAPEEDEGVIAAFLNEHVDFSLEPVDLGPGMHPGRPDWVAAGPPELARAVRLYPHTGPGEGHFIARLQRAGAPPDAPQAAVSKPRRAAPALGAGRSLTQGELAQFTAFWQDTFRTAPDLAGLAVVGSYLYRLPDPALPLTGLKVVHPGWWLGAFKPGRFEPSHALALACDPAWAHRCASYPADAPEITAYWRGEALTAPGADGWMLVCVDGFPLGWGKRVRNVVKNHYPKGLRRR